MNEWLKTELQPDDHACHSSPGIGGSTAAFYFRDISAARDFVRAFPNARLADGTLSPVYTSPRHRRVTRG